MCIGSPKARRHCREVPVVVDRLCAAGRAGGGEKQPHTHHRKNRRSRNAHLSKPTPTLFNKEIPKPPPLTPDSDNRKHLSLALLLLYFPFAQTELSMDEMTPPRSTPTPLKSLTSQQARPMRAPLSPFLPARGRPRALASLPWTSVVCRKSVPSMNFDSTL